MTSRYDRSNLVFVHRVDPAVPVIIKSDPGNNYVNLTWSPTDPGSSDSGNPGHKFDVEYRKKPSSRDKEKDKDGAEGSGDDGDDDGDEWTRIGPEQDHDWVNVTDLEPGHYYEFRVVARNNGDNTTTSNSTLIWVGPPRTGLLLCA